MFLSFSLSKERLAVIYTKLESNKDHSLNLFVVDLLTQKTIVNRKFDQADPEIGKPANFKAKIMQGQDMILFSYTTVSSS